MPISVVVLDQSEPSVAAKVVALQRAAYHIEAQLINFDGIPPLLETENDVSELKITILGALDGTDVVGIVGYRRPGDVVEIDRLAVNPGVFHSGIATFLIMDVRRREHDASRFEVSTGAQNYPAIALYTKLGFRRLPDTAVAKDVLIANFVNP
jgi:ribosomal protein S18 acetylase RimI-like enzyme